MRKLLLILLVFCATQGIAQMYLENNLTKDRIYSTGLDAINNQLRWVQLSQDLTTDTSGVIYCSDLWNDLDGMEVEKSDVGLSGRVLIYNFGLGVIIRRNLLNLDLNLWTLKE